MSNKTNFIFKLNYHIRINKLFDENMGLFSDINFDEIHDYHEKYNAFIYNYLKILVNQYFDSHHLQKPSLLRKIKIMNYLFFLYIKDNSHFPNLMDNFDFINCLYKSIDIFDSYIDGFNKNNWDINDFFGKIIYYVKNETSFKIEPRAKPKKVSKKCTDMDSYNEFDSDDENSSNLTSDSISELIPNEYELNISKYDLYQCPLIITFVVLFLECVITSGKMPDIKKYLMYSIEQFENSFIEFNNQVSVKERKIFLEKYIEETKNYKYFTLIQNYRSIINFSDIDCFRNDIIIKQYNIIVLITKMLKTPLLVKSIIFSGIFVESKLYITGSGAKLDTLLRQQVFNRVIENIFGKVDSKKTRGRVRNLGSKLLDFDKTFKENINSKKDIYTKFNKSNLQKSFEPIKQIFCCDKRKIESVYDKPEIINFFYFPYSYEQISKEHSNKKFCNFYLDPEESEFLNFSLF